MEMLCVGFDEIVMFRSMLNVVLISVLISLMFLIGCKQKQTIKKNKNLSSTHFNAFKLKTYLIIPAKVRHDDETNTEYGACDWLDAGLHCDGGNLVDTLLN